MAANLTENDKQFGLTEAWHGLTTVVKEISPKENWLTQWEIEAVPTFIQSENGPVELPFKILQASDIKQYIGRPFAKSYTPITNKQFMGLVEQIINETEGLKIESLGSVCNRGRVFVSLSLKGAKTYSAGGRDFEDFLNFGNGHDQSSTMWVNNSNTCIVCNNTFNYNMHLAEGGKGLCARIVHRGNIDIKLENVKGIIDNYLESQKVFIMKFNELAQQKISCKSVENLYKGWITRFSDLRKDNKTKKNTISARMSWNVDRLTDLFQNGRGNGGSTYADAFSAITDFYTHESAARGKRQERQFVSSEFGVANTLKRDFWTVINDQGKVEEYIKKGEQLAIAN